MSSPISERRECPNPEEVVTLVDPLHIHIHLQYHLPFPRSSVHFLLRIYSFHPRCFDCSFFVSSKTLPASSSSLLMAMVTKTVLNPISRICRPTNNVECNQSNLYFYPLQRER